MPLSTSNNKVCMSCDSNDASTRCHNRLLPKPLVSSQILGIVGGEKEIDAIEWAAAGVIDMRDAHFETMRSHEVNRKGSPMNATLVEIEEVTVD